jgi:hypothetical protein
MSGIQREKEQTFPSILQSLNAPDKLIFKYLKSFVSDHALTITFKRKTNDVLYNASVYKDDKGEVLGVFAAIEILL